MRRTRFETLRLVACAVVVATGTLVARAASADDPLAGVVLDDAGGRSWHLDELRGGPVLLIIADRRAAEQATAWGERLAARTLPVAPWRATDEVAWLSVADLRRVPDYARDSARERVRDDDAGRGQEARRQCSPPLLDWSGLLAERFGAERAEALVVLLAADRRRLVDARGAPTDATVTRLVEAIRTAVAP
jgi:hypothetical protein